MKSILAIALALLCAHAAFAQLADTLSGTLGPGDFHVVDTLYVISGDTLRLLPPLTLRFDGPFPFRIYGTLLAEGTASDSILFTTDTVANPTRWRGLRFQDASSSGSVLSYCRIELANQPTGNGGGIYCDYSSPAFDHCTVSRNAASSGGGVYCRYCSPTFTSCLIEYNSASDRRAGISAWNASPTFQDCIIRFNNGCGFYCGNSSPAFEDCVIRDNTGASLGGGMECYNCQGTFTNCTIESNGAQYGGGVYFSFSAPTFDSCTVRRNSASWGGGGFYCAGASTPIFANCAFHDNWANLYGGGAYITFDSRPRLTRCLLFRNAAAAVGGGVYCTGSSPRFTNCTISGNSVGYYGGGVYCVNSSPTFNSTIIAFSSGSGIYFQNSAACTVKFGDLYGNSGGNIAFYNANPTNGPPGIGHLSTVNSNSDSCDIYSNIFLKPMFVDTALADFHLQAVSPCIDAGDPALPLDPDGTVADIGAFYNDQRFHPPAAFTLVSPSWGDTCRTLDTMLVWRAALDPDTGDFVHYEVWLDTLAGLATASEVASALSDTMVSLEGLLDDHAYYWTVHASDLNTNGTWAGDTLMFRTYRPDPPGSFALASPENGDTVFTTTPTLRWRAARDPDPGDFVRYRLLWSYDADFAVSEDTMLTDTLFAFPPGLLFSGSLDEVADDSIVYWKVHAMDQFGLISWCVPSNGWSFRVFIEEPPSPFDLISPVHGDTLDSLSVEFVWAPSTDPDLGDSIAFYRVFLALDSIFSIGCVTEDVMVTHLLWDSLEDDQTYWWRVKAFDSYGAGTFSNQVRCFHTYFCEMPSPCALLGPADSLQLPFGEVHFRWQAARDPDPADTITYMLHIVAGDFVFAHDSGSDTCATIDVGALDLPDTVVAEWWVTAHSLCPDTSMESTSRFHFYPPSAISGRDISLPTDFALHPNYPNPFNPMTVIRYDVKQSGPVSVRIFDLLGREVATIVHETVPAGSYTAIWNAADFPSGVYLCQMEATGFRQTRKLLLVK
ncbi:MAG: right-handed parallel beta-helix repeat-containing protein [bacterium]